MPTEATEIHAALSLIGHSLGFDQLPLPDDDTEVPLLDPFEAGLELENVEQEGTIAPSTKLALLTHLVPRMPEDLRPALEPVARSLIRADVGIGTRQTLGRALLDLINDKTAGEDPFGRERDPTRYRKATVQQARRRARSKSAETADEVEAVTEETVFANLVDETEAVVTLTPICQATTQMIDDWPALSLSTTVTTREPLQAVKAMSDPLFWDDCEPQSLFFESMELLDPPRPPPTRLRGPDDGWRAKLLEVVDFSYGLNDTGSSRMSTELDFVHFGSDVAFGCTYDLHRSRLGRITVDRGYVLVEDLQSIDIRRTTTLKQVYFKTRPQPGNVCRFWSLAHGMVATSCALPRRTD